MGVDFAWFDRVVVPMGLDVSSPDDGARVAAGVTAGQPWTVTSRRSVDSEFAAEHSTVFVAPCAAVASVDVASMRAGAVPTTIRIERDDRVKAHLGGDEVLGLIATVLASLRLRRRDAVTVPRERVTFASEHDRGVPREVVDRIACWPGDACHGGSADAPPPSGRLARTPDGGLSVSVAVSPWTPLRMATNTFGDPVQLRHAIETWQMLVASLTADGVVVQRDPAGIRPPTSDEVAALADAMGDRLSRLKVEHTRRR